MQDRKPECALCPFDWQERLCHGKPGKAPGNCPTARHKDFVEQSIDEVRSEATCEFARNAAIQEGTGYADKEKGYDWVRPVKPRIQEVIEFAKRMDYRRVALIFCVGLRNEAAVVHKLFVRHGLDVISIICKVGGVPKETMGITEDQKVCPGSFEPMCNPMLQAGLANYHGSQFNVLLGLCVGHDSLFFKYADAPTTVLAVKDRVFGHNPLAAVYQLEGFYRCLNASDETAGAKSPAVGSGEEAEKDQKGDDRRG